MALASAGVILATSAGCGRDLYDVVRDGGPLDSGPPADAGPVSDAGRLDASVDAPTDAVAECSAPQVVLADGRCVAPLSLEVVARAGARTALLRATTNGDAELAVVASPSDLGALDPAAIRGMTPAASGTSTAGIPADVLLPTTPAASVFVYVVAFRPLSGGVEERASWSGRLDAEPLVQLRTFTHAGLESEIALFLPDAYFHDPSMPRPTILFLHGWGGATVAPDWMGVAMDDGLLQRIVSEPGRYVGFPFIVVAPHCIQAVHGGCWGWTNHPFAIAALDDVASAYPVDAARTYVTGLSTGGEGTFTVASAYPTRFAAAVPIASTYDAATPVCAMTDVPTWAFHGEADTLQPPSNSQSYVDRIASGCPSAPAEAPVLTLLPCRLAPFDHCGWIEAYDGTHGASVAGFSSIFDWMLAHTR